MGYKKVYFVSGIDTDAGKTFATGFLASRWRSEGVNVITQKFVQTGCGSNLEDVSEDIIMHRKLMSIDILPEDLDHTTCPVRFSYPASADLASKIDNREIDFGAIEASTDFLSKKYDTVLMEGAGGLMVPLKGLYTTLDYIEQHKLPLILITNPKLGSVNHTFLSLEVCKNRNIPVDFLVYNYFPETSKAITDDTRDIFNEYLRQYFPKCNFIEVPFIKL